MRTGCMLTILVALAITLIAYAVVRMPELQTLAVLLAAFLLFQWIVRPPQAECEHGWLTLVVGFLLGRAGRR